MLNVSPEVIHNELETAIAILAKWQKRMDQIPGVTIPVTSENGPAALEAFRREFIGELQIVSGKCDTLAEALSM